MGENILIVHGGGPTSVINASLYGAVKEAKKYKEIEHIYAAKNGTGGLMREELIEFENVPDEKLELLLNTPGSAIGTSRDQIEQAEYDRMIEVLLKKNIKYVLFNGGNGSMDTCGKLYKNCQARGLDIRVMGIPKTHDNDIAITDHSPGYGSIARYMAQCEGSGSRCQRTSDPRSCCRGIGTKCRMDYSSKCTGRRWRWCWSGSYLSSGASV